MPELIVSDAERPEFEDLQRDLSSQHQPDTALQRIGLELMLCCAWRNKLAIREEMRRLTAVLDIPRAEEARSGGPIGSAAMVKWFGSSRTELKEGIHMLEVLEEEVASKGRVPEEWKEHLDRAFGVEFYESLMEWPTISIDTIYLADHLKKMAEKFGSRGSTDHLKEVPQLSLDPAQNLNMVYKLVDQLLRFLRDLARNWEERGTTGLPLVGQPALISCYFTTATRDLHRAVEWYRYLKEHNL